MKLILELECNANICKALAEKAYKNEPIDISASIMVMSYGIDRPLRADLPIPIGDSKMTCTGFVKQMSVPAN